MSSVLVRFECWAPQPGDWRGSGRLELEEATPAEMTGDAVRRLANATLLQPGGRFRVWVPGEHGWQAEGEVSAGELALAARIHDKGGRS